MLTQKEKNTSRMPMLQTLLTSNVPAVCFVNAAICALVGGTIDFLRIKEERILAKELANLVVGKPSGVLTKHIEVACREAWHKPLACVGVGRGEELEAVSLE